MVKSGGPKLINMTKAPYSSRQEAPSRYINMYACPIMYCCMMKPYIKGERWSIYRKLTSL